MNIISAKLFEILIGDYIIMIINMNIRLRLGFCLGGPIILAKFKTGTKKHLSNEVDFFS